MHVSATEQTYFHMVHKHALRVQSNILHVICLVTARWETLKSIKVSHFQIFVSDLSLEEKQELTQQLILSLASLGHKAKSASLDQRQSEL